MYKLLLMCGLCLVSGETWAQVRKFAPKPNGSNMLVVSRPTVNSYIENMAITGLLIEPTLPTKSLDEAFRVPLIDNPPQFKGGKAGLKRFLQMNLHYPLLLLRSNVEGWTKV